MDNDVVELISIFEENLFDCSKNESNKPSKFDRLYPLDLIQVQLLIPQEHFDRFQTNFLHLKNNN
jgi:hypothetical protein